MEKLRKRFQRISKEKGITLVALVITIIILIILATVAINFAFGENGLVKMAERARDMQANSAVAEQEYMDALADELSNYIPAEVNIKESHTNESITIEVETADERVASYDYYVNGELKASQSESTYTTSITLENKDPYMPSGFRYLEGTVDTGYVKQDTSIGNVQINTGADTNPAKRNIANNIFDLAGNAGEWTTERRIDGTGYRVSGGSFRSYPQAHPAIDNNSMMYMAGITGDIDISSRPILYK